MTDSRVEHSKQYLPKIQAAYDNDDILLAASRIQGKNLFAGVDLETTLLTLEDPYIDAEGLRDTDVKEKCFLLAHDEAVSSLKQRCLVTTVQEGLNDTNWLVAYQGKGNCYPALVDHLLQGHELATFRFLARANFISPSVGNGISEVRNFRSIYYPGAPNDTLLLARKINPIEPAYEERIVKSEKQNPFPPFFAPANIRARELNMEYSSVRGVKITDGASNYYIANKGVITLENAIIAVQGVRNDIKGEKMKVATRELVTLTGSEFEAIRTHVDIEGNAMLKFAVYGVVKSDAPE